MRTEHLTYKMPSDEADALAGVLLDENSFDTLIDEDADVYKPDGSPLLKLRRGILGKDICTAAYQNLRHAPHWTNNRGAAAGSVAYASEVFETIDSGARLSQRPGKISGTRYKRAKLDGTLSNTNSALNVQSGIVGYFDRNPRKPYCRLTAFNLADEGKRFDAAMPFILAVSAVFQQEMPERYAAQHAIIRETSPDFQIQGTVFTTITVNKNWQTAVHQDAGDYKPGFGVMSCLRAGVFEGCYLCWPAYRVAANMRTGDVLLADVHEWHGNTPLKQVSKQYERISCVFYYRKGMAECGSATEELARAKTIPPGHGKPLSELKEKP